MSVGYDIGASMPIASNPQGTAGGGNVFNMAPLFGNLYGGQSSSTSGNSAAARGTDQTAATKGSSAPITDGGLPALDAATASWPSWAKTGAIAAALLIPAGILLWLLLRKK